MAASVLEVLITGDATQLKAAYVQAQAATEEFAASTSTASAATAEASASAARFGQTASRAFQLAKLGALAFAAVSVKNAIDFNREFTLIAAITDTAASRIDSLKGTVMQLSGETAQSPTDLAHALYFLASAGLTTTQQMQALDASAHGAAIGLGSTQDLARLTANALNAFHDQGLTAAQVMDTLTAAVREGTAEPDAFAQALGRVMPIADQAGISFMQVAASLATMSNAGLDVNEGVTSLRAILQSLVAPTAQTEKAFGDMGLTVTQVVDSMKGQGLIATLRLVSDAAKQSTDSTGAYNQMMRHAIPNIRGLAGALNLTHQQASKVDEIFKQITQSAGDTATAFATTAQSSAFKVKQSFQDLLNVGQQLASDVLPALASGMELVAKHSTGVFEVLGAFATVKWLIPFFKDLAAANTTLAASEVAAGQAAVTQAAEMQAAAASGATAGIGGGAVASQSIFARAAAARQAATVEAEATTAASAGAADATSSFAAMGLAVSGASTMVSRLGNTIGSSGLPQIFALIQGVRDASNELSAFRDRGLTGAIQSVMGSSTVSTLLNAFPGGGAIAGFLKSVAGPDMGAIQHLYDGLQSVKSAFSDLGISAKDQATITTKALADIGASSLADVTTSNIDQYVTAVNTEISATQQQKQAADQAKAAALELQKQIQANTEASKTWQDSTAQMTAHLDGLARVGINVNDFMSQLKSDLAGSTDQTKTFTDAIGTVTKAWNDFKTQAQTALFFIPKALDDLTSAAQQAQSQLDSMTSSSTATNAEIDQLRQTANLTGQDILTSFQQANAQSKAFFQNLLDISKVGGSAGKDLAASLLQSGNVVAANIIAHSDLEKQIVKTFGTGEQMASKFATKLTDSIVGPLDDITTILAKIGKSLGVTGLNMYLNDHGAQKKADHLKNTIDNVKGTHQLHMTARDDATRVVEKVQHDVSTVVAAPYQITLGLTSTKARAQLASFDSTLNTFLSKKRQIVIGVHTKGDSPMPDEALKIHLFDPMKAAGFKRVGNAYTLPLVIGAHTDPSTFPGGKGPTGNKQKIPGLDAMAHIEQRQLQVLFDIRRELKATNAGPHGSLSPSGSSSSGSGSSSAPSGSLSPSGGSSGTGKSGSAASSLPHDLQRQLKDFGLYVKSVQGPMYGDRFVKEMTKALKTPGIGQNETMLLKQAMRDMAKVTNPEEAHKAADAWRKAARDWSANLKEQEKLKRQAEYKQFMANALSYATHNVPKLPRGHTNISVNHHERHKKREVTLDRKRFAEAAGYEVDYARGF